MDEQERATGRTDDEPTTEEALPGVKLGADEETEETARETLGPEAAEDAQGKGGSDEPYYGEDSPQEPLYSEK